MHADAGQGVERPERLVGQQELGAADDGAGQGHALLLAAGQLMRPGALASAELHLGQGLTAACADVGSAKPQHHIVEHALPGQQAGVLEHHRDALGHGDLAGAFGLMVEVGQGAQ